MGPFTHPPSTLDSRANHPSLPVPEYYCKLAKSYLHDTGRTTFDVLAAVITDHIQTSTHPINSDSVVHDTAAGPGVGAAAIVACLSREELPKEILVSDTVCDMVKAARASLTSSLLPYVVCQQLDSQDLESVPNDYFTHSINNCSIFAMSRPSDAIWEMYRTLRPGGLAVITCWRRFAPRLVIHAAQTKIRPDLPLMPTPRPEYSEEGVLQKVIIDNGFSKENVQSFQRELIVSDVQNIAGLTGLMSGPLMLRARQEYTIEEEAIWPKTIKECVDEEVKLFGGIRFEFYAVLATK
ncbi:hypothetical protein BJ166DRAFT_594339 [Pestalotiopsis sp. NC0098]|nr:hypothetical protein BJ166DRAFT_594339 [Pestalotiopsis sp. NC0098]